MGEPLKVPKVDEAVWWCLRREIRRREDFSLGAKDVFEDLWRLAGYKPDTVNVTTAALADVVGISPRQVRRCLETLGSEDVGLIEIFKRPPSEGRSFGPGYWTLHVFDPREVFRRRTVGPQKELAGVEWNDDGEPEPADTLSIAGSLEDTKVTRSPPDALPGEGSLEDIKVTRSPPNAPTEHTEEEDIPTTVDAEKIRGKIIALIATLWPNGRGRIGDRRDQRLLYRLARLRLDPQHAGWVERLVTETMDLKPDHPLRLLQSLGPRYCPEGLDFGRLLASIDVPGWALREQRQPANRPGPEGTA